MPLDRRQLLKSGGLAAFATFVPQLSTLASTKENPQSFQWQTDELIFGFDLRQGRLRQRRLTPAGLLASQASSGVEVALQCSGENSPDQGMKFGMGQPGSRLLFVGHREESTARG